eukprot:TRINITY_DN14039_c1_g1_i1.p1 TRINITY_DN14039_c1_g1~~TRINITY_DN14039_c1_g1_i1.p1  ORF type:complete len:227 (+),score=81.30 TRINITY_DN14039_c1_g1_i1:273-953(+)
MKFTTIFVILSLIAAAMCAPTIVPSVKPNLIITDSVESVQVEEPTQTEEVVESVEEPIQEVEVEAKNLCPRGVSFSQECNQCLCHPETGETMCTTKACVAAEPTDAKTTQEQPQQQQVEAESSEESEDDQDLDMESDSEESDMEDSYFDDMDNVYDDEEFDDLHQNLNDDTIELDDATTKSASTTTKNTETPQECSTMYAYHKAHYGQEVAKENLDLCLELQEFLQ